MTAHDLFKYVDAKKTEKLPVIFVGHGNPMNAITDNVWRKSWIELGKDLIKPRAILCISAHWLTGKETAVAITDSPQTIHDFYGFPPELYAVEYPAPGAPSDAHAVSEIVISPTIVPDPTWGLDHGAWSVLSNMYPAADVPIFQMSVAYKQTMQYHFDLAKKLNVLRQRGVLIVTSGNLVHNLQRIRWEKNAKPYDWALEFDAFVKKNIEDDNADALIDYKKLGSLALAAHPTNDHYLPLIYAIGLRNKTDAFRFFSEGIDAGSISMRSVIFQ
jgi:4,5-DOPA dioxygenase extradiol